MNKYVAITPARDEEKFLPGLLDSMLQQSVLPERWIVIDDGSTDSTPQILDKAASAHPWIEVHHLSHDRPRAEGGESIIMQFLPREVWERYDYILRLDADISFRSEFVKSLLAEFARDPKLGIAGPTLYEPQGAEWKEIRSPAFHTRGAAKMYSRICFASIGGLENGLGWDTIDEARAMMMGLRSRAFPHIRAHHHRPQGAAGGLWKSRMAAGLAAYKIGYSPLFILARAIRRSLEPPFPFGGILLLAGYVQAGWQGTQRISSPEVVKFVRQQQVRRLIGMDSSWR